MIELGKHLETLLLSNDCVAVPDFGGFVAHYVSARVSEADKTFLPPMRAIGFNPQLKMNDSLLAQSYVETYDISYPEALRMIEQEVDEIRRQLQHEGLYHLNGIGTLIANDEGNYSFEPLEAGLLTPSLYGLCSYEFDLLKPLQARPTEMFVQKQEETIEPEEEETAQQSLIELLDDEEEEHAIRVKMSWLRNSIAVAAAITLFFFLTTPIANSNLDSQTMSTLQNTFFTKLMPKDSNTSDIPAVEEKSDVSLAEIAKPEEITLETMPESATETKAEASKKVAPQVVSQEDKPYCLVLASQVKRSNAEEFVRLLQKKGFKDTEIYVNNNIVRVVYGHFVSEGAAYTELHNLRFEEHFEEAWVYKKSN